MELGKVDAIQAVGSVSVNRSASDAMPAFSVDGARRMQDDSYGGDAKEQDRGMEQEAAELVDHAEKAEEAAAGKEEGQQVNLFA